MSEKRVIDETFAGLARPAEVHALGRPDLEEGRPGDVLVEEVRRFESEGGFRGIAAERQAERRAEADADASVPRDGLPDFGRTAQDGPDGPDASKDSSDK